MREKKEYDPSLDYARYPTLALLSTHLARCEGCGSSDFQFLLPDWRPMCLQRLRSGRLQRRKRILQRQMQFVQNF